MAVHRMNSITLGVPDVEKAAEFYRDFGLTEVQPKVFATEDGGEQMKLVQTPLRRLVELNVGAETPDDVDRVASQIAALDVEVQRPDGRPYGRTEDGPDGPALQAVDPGTGVRVLVEVAPPIEQPTVAATPYNGPGRDDRVGRAPSLTADAKPRQARPKKLGHVVIGTTEMTASKKFFEEAIGFKVSDEIRGQAFFMRCSTDHHNVLLQSAPLQFLHHTSWQVEDVDAIGQGAKALLDKDPARHAWGFGRHHIGSNFFWYFRDPAGNFCEYYSDMDVISDDQLWKPEVWDGMTGFYAWGPPPPASFIRPDDLTELMAGLHSAKA